MGFWPGLQVGSGVGFFVGDRVLAAGVVVIVDGVAVGVRFCDGVGVILSLQKGS